MAVLPMSLNATIPTVFHPSGSVMALMIVGMAVMKQKTCVMALAMSTNTHVVMENVFQTFGSAMKSRTVRMELMKTIIAVRTNCGSEIVV